MIDQKNCIICDANSVKQFIKVSDRFSQHSEYYNLVKCKCNLIYLHPKPDSRNISSYYKHVDYDSHNNAKNNSWTKIYNIVQWISFRWKFIKIAGKLKPGWLLDIGGGKGEFAEFMTSQGWKVAMQDAVADKNADHASYHFVKELHQIDDSHSFDVITLWHSLEHIHNIQELFVHINRLLAPDGKLFIAVPNIHAPERKVYGSHWAPFDAPRHLYHFEPETLKKLCKKYHFKVLRKYSLFQDTPYNIFLSIPKMSILQLIIAAFILICSLFQIILRGPDHSSSFLVICKKS